LVGSDCTPASGDLRIGVCESCGLVQKEISSAWSELCAKIYGNFQIYHQGGGQEQKARGTDGGQLKPRSELIASFLSGMIPMAGAGSALDIGCGNGPFLRAMNKVFSEWSLTGSDLSDQFRAEIESISPKVSYRLSRDLATSDKTYDVVSLIHSIEHIPAPADFLANAKRHLKKTGVLLIQVPDAELNPFDLVVADHASHFSKATMAAEVEAAGYQVLACGNLVVGKEITVVARPLQDRPATRQRKVQPGATDVARRNLAWLNETLKSGEKLAREKRPLGVFGTGIAGVWIGNVIRDHLDFYCDEDEARIGHDYLEIPIIGPADIPASATVFVCLEPKLAAAIAARLSTPDRHVVVPPAVDTE
jgi:2-polyprenyl-3-methyl-5-hydroxy-6-metoxy-1,4-benzoquinol methylase